MIEALSKAVEKVEDIGSKGKTLENFNPDKRCDVNEKTNSGEEHKNYNPDKRLSAPIGGILDKLDNFSEIKKLAKDYTDELKHYSDHPETLNDFKVNPFRLRDVSGEALKEMRSEFNKNRESLIKEWENLHGMEWPRYKKDVIIPGTNTVLHKAGDRLDAHHKVPLCIGGTNSAENITPIRADVHYDHKGIHATGGACDKLCKTVKGVA